MKNKTLIIAIIVLIVIGTGIGIYFWNKGANTNTGEKQNLLVKNDFSINLPEGWEEAPAPTGVSAMAVNANEEITNADAQKVNFRSYCSVVYNTMKGEMDEEFIEKMKDSLTQSAPEIVITDEKKDKIGDKDTYFVEAEINQKNIDFKILLTLIKGAKEDVWVVSFNTLKSNWERDKDLFYETAKSFTEISEPKQ